MTRLYTRLYTYVENRGKFTGENFGSRVTEKKKKFEVGNGRNFGGQLLGEHFLDIINAEDWQKIKNFGDCNWRIFLFSTEHPKQKKSKNCFLLP